MRDNMRVRLVGMEIRTELCNWIFEGIKKEYKLSIDSPSIHLDLILSELEMKRIMEAYNALSSNES